jgi:hypothetical protein
MTDLNLDPITAVVKAISSMAISPIKNQLERNEKVIQLRKTLNLPPDHPPADFTAVYQYALVDYGVDKPQPLLKVFRQKDIIQAFRQAFEQKDQSILLEKGEDFLSWNILGDRVHELKVDIRKEFTDFQSAFLKVANSTRTPESEQNAIASMILDEIEDERRWDEAFSRSPDILAKLAASAMAEYRSGKTQELDLETL